MFPIPSGMATSLICKAIAKNVDIKLAWTCPVLYLKALSNEVANSTIFISTLKMKTSSIDNGINCSCLLTAEDFITSTTIKLDVNSTYFILFSNYFTIIKYAITHMFTYVFIYDLVRMIRIKFWLLIILNKFRITLKQTRMIFENLQAYELLIRETFSQSSSHI